ncbi:MAG: hypothetical protein Kow0058_10050 [Roseovarius sp.]
MVGDGAISALLGPQDGQRPEQVPEIHAPGSEGRPARDLGRAETRAGAEAALDTFAEKYRAKYGKAVSCLTRDRETLPAFYDFPADHWDHLRTANPIESVFATFVAASRDARLFAVDDCPMGCSSFPCIARKEG